MSRAYRVSVRESLYQVVRGEDSVETTVELLEILPCEEMAGLLRDELSRRGFKPEADRMIRKDNGLTIEVNPASGEVVVRAEETDEFAGETDVEGHAFDDHGQVGHARTEASLREQARKTLEAGAQARSKEAQGRATARLEGELEGLRSELDQVVNRVTADALKRKASRLGQIKEITEDERDGSLTIVLEV